MITLYVGIFFLILAVAFGFSAGRENRASGGSLTPARKARRRVAVIFGLVGLGLVLMHLSR